MDNKLHIFLRSALDGRYGQRPASGRIYNQRKKMSDNRRGDKAWPAGLTALSVTVPTELPRVSIIIYNPIIQQLIIND